MPIDDLTPPYGNSGFQDLPNRTTSITSAFLNPLVTKVRQLITGHNANETSIQTNIAGIQANAQAISSETSRATAAEQTNASAAASAQSTANAAVGLAVVLGA